MGRLGQTDTVRGKIWLFRSRDEEKQACMFVLKPHLLHAWVFIDFYPAKKKATKLLSSSTYFFFNTQLRVSTHLMEQKSQKYLRMVFWVSAQAAVKESDEI